MLDLCFADDVFGCGVGAGRFLFVSVLASRALAHLLSRPFARGDGLFFFVDPASVPLLLLDFDDAVEPEEECPFFLLLLVDVDTTVSLEDVLPKRRDSRSKVLRVSDREAFDSNISDS